jgi:serine/threonine protein kinase
MAEALHYVHAHNVIHRYIKPSNILLVDYGNEQPRARAMLTDFGIARADDVDRLTAEGVTTGTVAYLSPEQAMGSDVGPESDVSRSDSCCSSASRARWSFRARCWSRWSPD